MFACDGDVVEPLAPFPIPYPTLWCWSDDWTHVLAVDQERKRASTFRLEGETFEPTMSPRTLPKGINAHCVAMKGAQPYVGAQSVWLPVDERGWQQIPMPGFARGEGKRLDGLIIDGHRLVAVDDLLLPKWNLEYDITDPGQPVYMREEEMRANITYERIFSASGGDHWFVTLSRGINHGNEAFYCTVFDLETLQQAHAYPFYTRLAGTVPGELVSLRCAVFLGDLMCLLAQRKEDAVVYWLDLSEEPSPPDPPVRGKKRRTRPALHEELVEGLKAVHHIHPSRDGGGIYLSGPGEDGETHIQWQPQPQID